jgi:hypothetical protein
MKSARLHSRSDGYEISHITDHDTRLFLFVGALSGFAGLFVSVFCRVAFAIGVLFVFATALALLALMGPLMNCAVASGRIVGRRQRHGTSP